MREIDNVIVVSDANIFIDLCNVGLLEDFFLLPWHIHTTDMVYSEVKEPEQKKQLEAIKSKIHIKTYAPSELLELWKFQQEIHRFSNLSIQDCSILSYCKRNGYTLLTGDKVLRTKAEEKTVTVRGIIYIFDQLVNHGIVIPQTAAEKLEQLFSINHRLPQKEIEKRITRWIASDPK